MYNAHFLIDCTHTPPRRQMEGCAHFACGPGFYLGSCILRIRYVNYVRKVAASSDAVRHFLPLHWERNETPGGNILIGYKNIQELIVFNICW